MNRTIAICGMIAWFAVWAVIVITSPWLISDHNKFLHDFIGQEFLTFMGVVVTITLSSGANIFVELNKIEDKAGEHIFLKTRSNLKNSCYSLLYALAASIALVIIKPIVTCGEISESIINGMAITILLFSILVLTDITSAGFRLNLRGD